MRVLLLLIIVCSLLLWVEYATSNKAIRIDQEYCEGVLQPSAKFMTEHAERLDRLATHLRLARDLALLSGLAGAGSLLLSVRWTRKPDPEKRSKNVG